MPTLRAARTLGAVLWRRHGRTRLPSALAFAHPQVAELVDAWLDWLGASKASQPGHRQGVSDRPVRLFAVLRRASRRCAGSRDVARSPCRRFPGLAGRAASARPGQALHGPGARRGAQLLSVPRPAARAPQPGSRGAAHAAPGAAPAAPAVAAADRHAARRAAGRRPRAVGDQTRPRAAPAAVWRRPADRGSARPRSRRRRRRCPPLCARSP